METLTRNRLINYVKILSSNKNEKNWEPSINKFFFYVENEHKTIFWLNSTTLVL